MDGSQGQDLLPILQKLTVFRGLTVGEAKRLLRISSYESYEQSETIYVAGESSLEMLVLLQGKLQAVSGCGEVVGEILPGASVGEMGVFTGEPRCATVITAQPSTALAMRRQELGYLLKTQQEMHVKILQNIVGILSQRLDCANRQIEGRVSRHALAEQELAEESHFRFLAKGSLA